MTDLLCSHANAHRERWSDGLLNPFALAQDNTVKHASDVDRNRDGPFRCVECKRNLILKAGDIRQHHFAHEKSDQSADCRPVWSALRRYATELISKEMHLLLPARRLPDDPRKIERSPERVVTFDQVSPPSDGMMGDLILVKSGRSLRLFLRSGKGPASLEPQPAESALALDLSKAPIAERDQLDAYILSASPREWLWHRNDAHWATTLLEEKSALGLERWSSSRTHTVDLSIEEDERKAARLRKVGSLISKHQPRLFLPEFFDAPQPFLGDLSPRQYNAVASDIEYRIQVWLGLRSK